MFVLFISGFSMQQKSHCHFCGSSLDEIMFEGRLRLFCQECRAPIYENPVPATCVITTSRENRVLLVKRSVDPRLGFWCLPGGFIELGETPESAATRELLEETGLCATGMQLLGATSSSSDQYHTVLLLCYRATGYRGTLEAGDDASAAAFFPTSKLPEIAFDSHQRFIRDFSS
jgi:8-oxo-dGTP diphosphatase